MKKQIINQPVLVSAIVFDKQFDPLPRRIEYQGKSLELTEQLMRYRIKQGSKITQLFDMSDGEQSYRLRLSGSSWHLLSIG